MFDIVEGAVDNPEPPVVVGWPGDFLCDEDAYRQGDWLSYVGPAGTVYVFDEATAFLHCARWDFLKNVWRTRFVIADGSVSWRVPVRWIRTQLLGTLGGVETFSVGLNYTDATNGAPSVTAADLQNVATLVAAAWDAWLVTDLGQGQFPTDVVFQKVAASYLENTGGAKDTTLLPSAYANLNGSSGRAGTGANPSLPYETSCCVTLETGYTGRGGRGRFYLPPFPTNAMTTGGKYSTSWATGSINGKIGIRLNSIAGGAWHASVVSKKHQVARTVSRMSIGVIPDSQRRRRHNQAEARAQVWP